MSLLATLNNVCLKFKNIRYIKRENRITKTRKIEVKNAENKEIIMAITMTKTITKNNNNNNENENQNC